ncbi:hypothetical protein M501DRAFT_1009791 [Patellaria atrata CBS 101060]|uniref:Rhodopsin domain-containing protein n=1 Tax=Patellaria atrata CBS 101060 TaxID=1346257 RepID=A0A9P4S2Q7_9PEZI|nr:hypothetical protein M501DRAFT_1009791 [Patellaria atrata CBS 101060]
MSAPLPSFIPPPTHINDTHKHYDVAAGIIIMLIVGTSVTILRLWCQWRAQLLGYDDWAIMPALVLYIGHSIMGVYCNLCGGIGKPLWEVSYPEFQIWFKGIVGTTFLYPLMTASVRISILLFYQRIFSQAHTVTRWAIRVTLSLTAIFVVVYSILPGFVCTPISYGWRLLEDRATHCKSNQYYYEYTLSLYSLSIAFDVLLIIIPIYPVMKLQMSLQKRVGAIVMFALGASSCVAASYKLAELPLTKFEGLTNPLSLVIPPQFDDYGYTFWIPSQVEPTTAMIGASLPALRRLFKTPFKFLTSTLRSWTGTTKIGTGSSSSRGSGRSGQDCWMCSPPIVAQT